MLRRRAALSIRMNALISLKPSESEMKSLISAIDNALPLEPCGADGFGAPSKKNSTGTCRIWDICCNRLAPMRLAPLSYFCTCWKLRPSAAPQLLANAVGVREGFSPDGPLVVPSTESRRPAIPGGVLLWVRNSPRSQGRDDSIIAHSITTRAA